MDLVIPQSHIRTCILSLVLVLVACSSTQGEQKPGGSSGTAGVGAPGGSAGTVGNGGSGGAGGSSGGAGHAAVGAMFYIAPNGSDSNPGTETAPFRTLTKARDAVRTINRDMSADIHVYVSGGRYELTSPVRFGPEDSGSNGRTIYYIARAGEAPVFTGATVVGQWTRHDVNSFKAPLDRSSKLRNLYVNDARAFMASKQVTAAGGQGTHSVRSGEAPWAWASGSSSDGVKYGVNDVPNIVRNRDDLEIVNGTTWNENIVTVRDVITTPDNYRALLLQQPYGAIAQLPGWNAGFKVTGAHTIVNALEFLDAPGEFYFDKAAGTLYYHPRSGEDMATAIVEAPVAETLIEIAGTGPSDRVQGITFQGITFSSTDYSLYQVANSRGKATVQGATVYVAYGSGNWHDSKYEITDTLPAMINVAHAQRIQFIGNVVKHSGNEGISLVNDVVDVAIIGNVISDIAGSGITVGHPQHVYLGDGGEHAKYAPEREGVCTNILIANNLIYETSSLRGFGGHSGITAFFVEGLTVSHNQIQKTAYNGINLGWGWRNFKDSNTCKNNSISNNRFIDTLTRLHDSGAIYTIGQMPGTTINENFVRGIPAARSGPTYGLHNDEGSAFITENDNVLEIDPGVTYTINCEDFGEKHDLTVKRTYATVSKMGADPPDSDIDPPVAVPDNVWPVAQYETALRSGIEPEYGTMLLQSGLVTTQDYVFPAGCEVPRGTATLAIRSIGDAASEIWFAPAGTTRFAEGPTMTRTTGVAMTIAVPASAGIYKLHVLDSQSRKLGESAALLRVK